jgi:hypothetical protein
MLGRGGEEDPCVPRATLLKIQRDPKRICPRFELTEDNEVLAEIAWFAVKLGGDHPLFHKLFDLHTAELSPEGKRRAFLTVVRAVSDEGIAARIKAERERALKVNRE